jgi:hypothetical protein
MPVTQTDLPTRRTSLAPPVVASAIVSTQPRKELAKKGGTKPDGAREPFDFEEYIEFLQYAEWGWF